jgi:hypothetical protein
MMAWPHIASVACSGSYHIDDAHTEECDGGATGTPCDGACTPACSCPQPCETLDLTGHWEGVWVPR